MNDQPADEPTPGSTTDPTTEEELLLDLADGVLRITVNRPHVMNAVDGAMLERAAEAVEATARPDSTVRVVVITAAGDAFSAGADLRRLERGGTHENGNRLVKAIVEAPVPVVAAVNGPAAGIAMSIALAADFTIAHESAYFLQAFVNIGLMPDGGATELLAAAIGRARATRLSLLGERLRAARAAEMGLIDRVCGDDFADQVDAVVTKLASGPTRAYAATKQSIAANTLRHLDETLERELRLQRELAETHDAQEGIGAFLAKRPAEFTGR